MIAKYFSSKNIIIGLSLMVLVLIGLLVWQLFQKPSVLPPEEEKEGGIVYKPWSETAEKYYPGGGNAIDFRDKAQGDFTIELSKEGEKVILNWPAEIKVVGVRVYNLGTLRDLQDHKIVFDMVNWDINNPPVISEEEITEVLPETTSQPEVYLFPPYTVGEILEGFFDNTLYEKEEEKGKPVFEKGDRYSIEIYGISSGGKYLGGYYTFNYE